MSRGGTYLSLTFSKSHLTWCGSEQTRDLRQSSVTHGAIVLLQTFESEARSNRQLRRAVKPGSKCIIKNELKEYNMNNERGRAVPSVYQPAQSAYQQGDTARLKPANLRTFLGKASAALAVFLLGGGIAAAQGNSPVQLRQFIGKQVGGIANLQVLDSLFTLRRQYARPPQKTTHRHVARVGAFDS